MFEEGGHKIDKRDLNPKLKIPSDAEVGTSPYFGPQGDYINSSNSSLKKKIGSVPTRNSQLI